MVLLALLGLTQRLSMLGSALAWQGSYFTSALVLLISVGALQRIVRAYVHVSVVSATFAAVVRASLEGGADIPVARDQEPLVAVSDAVRDCARGLVDVAIPLGVDIMASIIAFAVLAAELEPLSMVAALGAMVLAGVGAVMARSLTARRSSDTFHAYLAALDDLTDAFEGRAEVVASGAADTFLTRAVGALERWKRAAFRSDVSSKIISQGPIAVVLVGAVAIIVNHYGVSPRVIRDGVLLLGAAPAFVGVVRGAHELWGITPRVAPIAELLQRRPQRRGCTPAPPDVSALVWERVVFAYGSREVLSGVTVEATRGHVLALAGPNGAGKSTLLRIAVGLLDVQAGRLVAGDVNVSEVEPTEWRSKIRYLPQRPYLAPRRDVHAAMLFPTYESDVGPIEKALHDVGLWARLASFPTPGLGVPTDALSAGERQRLALARVLAREGDLYLLDEPDANLDAAGITMVAGLLRTLAVAGKIVVVAAHTTEVIQAADRVVHLDSGRVVSIEEGQRPVETTSRR